MVVSQSDPFSIYELLQFGTLEIKPQRMTDEQFVRFALSHEDLRVEQDKNGVIEVISPVGFKSGVKEVHSYGALYAWWLTHRKGRVLSPSTMFYLPDRSKKMADAAWVSESKYHSLPESERRKVAKVVPDFVIEVRSETDDPDKLDHKMKDVWMANGVRLAWLIDPIERTARVYHANGETEEMEGFQQKLSGGEVCPGFEFDLAIMDL